MTVIERIDELRMIRGWSINNLATEAMITQSTLNNMYTRGAEPKLSTLRAICSAFEISLTDFFSGIEEERKSDCDKELAIRISVLSGEEKNALLILLRAMQNDKL